MMINGHTLSWFAHCSTIIVSIILGLFVNSCYSAPPVNPTINASPQIRVKTPTLSATQFYARITQKALATEAYWAGNPATTEQLIADLQGEDKRARVEAIYSLQSRNDVRAAEALILALHDSDGQIKQIAGDALSRMGPVAVEPLIAALKDPDPTIQNWAAQDLGKLNDERAVEPLIVALQDQTYQARGSAASALGQLHDVRAVEPLIAAALDQTFQARDSAAFALAEIGDTRALDPLVVMLLQDSAPYYRGLAADLLGKMADPRAIDPLISALNDSSSEVTSKAVSALDVFKDPRAITAILDAIRDRKVFPSPSVFAAYGAPAVPVLIDNLKDSSLVIQNHAVQSLIAIGQPAVEPMLAFLNSQDLELVANAHEFYVALGQPGTEPTLIASLEKYGDSSMATCFLNSKNETLSKAGKAWAKAHDYMIIPGSNVRENSTWGSFK